MTYTPKEISLPEISGLSQKTLLDHIALYQGYVKNFNTTSDSIERLSDDVSQNMTAIAELKRRLSFEWSGIRLHEIYFSHLDQRLPITKDSPFERAIIAQFGNIDNLVSTLKLSAMTRGIGWTLLYHDSDTASLHIGFASEHQVGIFASLPVLLAIDVWEHAYVGDFGALGRASYLDTFFASLNWQSVEKRFA